MWAVFLEALIVAPPFLDMCLDICGAYGWLAVLSTNIKTQQRLDILGLLWPFNVNKNYLYTVLCATFNYPFCSWITMTTFANLMLISHLMGNWWGEGGQENLICNETQNLCPLMIWKNVHPPIPPPRWCTQYQHVYTDLG